MQYFELLSSQPLAKTSTDDFHTDHLTFSNSSFSKSSQASIRPSCHIDNNLPIHTQIQHLKMKLNKTSIIFSIKFNLFTIKRISSKIQIQQMFHNKAYCNFRTHFTMPQELNKYRIHLNKYNKKFEMFFHYKRAQAQNERLKLQNY